MSNLEEIRQQYRINFVRPSIPIENDVLGSIHTTPESGNGYASWAVHSRGIGMSIMKKSGYIEGSGLGKHLQGIKFPVQAVESRNMRLSCFCFRLMRGIGYLAPEEAEGSSDCVDTPSCLKSVANCSSEVSKGKLPVCSAVRRKISTEKKTESGFKTKPDSSAAPSKSIVPHRKRVQISFIYLLNGNSMSSPAVGIHFGTTHTCVAVFQNGKIEIFPNDQGSRTTPSCVAFSDTDERLIGDAALSQLVVNPKNTVFDAKRLIGRKYNHSVVQAGKNNWPFEVTGDEEGGSQILVKYKNKTQTYSPEDIASIILRKIKEINEVHIGKTINEAVISVPTYFDDVQREATKQAGLLAGFQVLRVINESTAAQIAYCLDRKFGGARNVLTFHLGGSTFSVSVLTIENGSVEVKSSAVDAHLGGECFDTRLVNHFVRKINIKYRKDMDNHARLRLRSACKKAKHVLSVSTHVDIQIDSLFEGIDYRSGASFETLIEDLLSPTIPFVEDVIHDANMEKCEIQDVILIGGSTRIPRLQTMLKDHFTGTCIFHDTIEPDEVVAYGAAIQAAILLSQ